ncbi:hypothetical protein [Flavobacterium sp. ov086]|uniref:hypothetical protein n=1 Tax=Flavobacterium sp. ov086 TaxID=1761785 RepID=UPI000B69896C|nr:hypothetical protein [Flavobacterium sp. ov086]SNR83566.1 hypothetical protein SAMN04487979_12423 [Flavobacterium sp. ov086]
MGEFLVLVGGFTAFISVIAFLIGIGRLIFISDDKKVSLKIILYSVIAFIIGFGTCAANFSLGGMH